MAKAHPLQPTLVSAITEPVRSLRYFAGLLEEVLAESFPPSYWRHVEFNLRRCERLWRNQPVEGTRSARPDLAQADSSGGTWKPSSAAQVGTRRRRDDDDMELRYNPLGR